MTDKENLIKTGIHIGKTNDIVKDMVLHNEIIETVKINSLDKKMYKCRYEFQGNHGVYDSRINLNEIHDRDDYVVKNNIDVFQKWYEADLSLNLDEVKKLHGCVEYFKELIESFIFDFYPDLKDNIYHNCTFTLYEDGHFIVPHQDGQNVGRRCGILIYLSDENEYNDGGGRLITKIDDNIVDVYPFRENFVILDFTKNNIIHSVEEVKNGFKRYTFIDFVYNKKEFDENKK